MRPDGRTAAQLRPITITTDFVPSALGSVLIESGRTRVICTVSLEPKTPPWLANGGWLTAEYAMLPGATQPRGRRDPGGRGKEIQRLIGRSLRAGVALNRLVGPDGGLSLYCDCDVIEADGGTRTASITGATVALRLAIHRMLASGQLLHDPVVDSIAAVSVGLVGGESEIPRAVLDLCYEEDHQASVDLNVVMQAGNPSPRLVEVQGTAEGHPFSRTQLNEMLDLAETGLVELFDAQQRALAEAVNRG